MKTENVYLTVYKNEEATQLLESSKAEFSTLAINSGRRDAEENLPKEQGDNFKVYLMPLISKVQHLLDHLRRLHRADEEVVLQTEAKSRSLNRLRNEHDDLTGEKKKLETELKKISDLTPKNFAFAVSLLVLLLGVLEGIYSLEAIRTFVPSYMTALTISIIFGVGLSIIAHKVYTWWSMSKNKYLIRSVIIFGMSSVFFALGILRSYNIALSNLSIEESGNTSTSILDLASTEEAFIYLLISWVVFLPACLLAQYTPTKHELYNISKRKELLSKLDKLKDKIKLKKQELDDLEDEINSLSQLEYSRNMTAKRDEQEALNLVDLLKAEYIKSNIKHRYQSKEHPSCFFMEFDPQLKSYFQNIQFNNPKTI